MRKLTTLTFFSIFAVTTFANVTFTEATGGTLLDRSISCANGTPGGFATLGDIVITEQMNNDIKAGQTNSTLILTAPYNWQFNSGGGSYSTTGDDISAISMNITTSTITITYSTFASNNGGQDGIDEIRISGIQVQAINGNIVGAEDYIYPSGTALNSNNIKGLSSSTSLCALSLDYSSVLPVELTSFVANVSESNVNLQWTTATEVNNYGFEIQGSGATNNWVVLGFVEGYGNSNSPKTYNFTDSKLNGSGTYSYRLKQIDNDGSYEFSKTIEVNIGSPVTIELKQNYPNPFNPSTTISFTISESGNTSLKIFNTLGEEMTTLVNGYTEAGIYSYNFNAENLPSGFYIYQLKTNENSLTKKMLFLK